MKSAWEEAPQLNSPCLTEFQTWYIFVPDRGVFVAMTLVTTAATQLDRDAWFPLLIPRWKLCSTVHRVWQTRTYIVGSTFFKRGWKRNCLLRISSLLIWCKGKGKVDTHHRQIKHRLIDAQQTHLTSTSYRPCALHHLQYRNLNNDFLMNIIKGWLN